MTQYERQTGLTAHTGGLPQRITGLQSVDRPEGADPASEWGRGGERLPVTAIVIRIVTPAPRGLHRRTPAGSHQSAERPSLFMSGVDCQRILGLPSRRRLTTLPEVHVSQS